MKMEYNAQVLRGWPYDGALDRAETIKASVSLTNGDWVQKQSDNTVDKVGGTKTANAGLVIRGNADSGSGTYTNKATVLCDNLIAKINTATSFTPGQNLTVQNNALVAGTFGTDPIIGYVLDVIASSATEDASVVVFIR